jgi:adenylate kinase
MHRYIIIIGPQGSGKGTQSELLCQDYDLTHISIGEIFRWNMAQHTKLAARIKRIMNEGRLVPDEIVEEVVRRRLEEHDWNYGFVLDGFPRTLSQAQYLFENWNLDAAVYLDISEKVIHERVMHRAAVGEGSGFTKRADDNPEALKVRIAEYQQKTAPLLDLFRQKDMLVTVPAEKSIPEVYQALRQALGLPEPRKHNPEFATEHQAVSTS